MRARRRSAVASAAAVDDLGFEEVERRPRPRTLRPGLDWLRHPGARRYLWQPPARAMRKMPLKSDRH